MLFSLHTRLRVHWAPGIPCALCLLGERFLHNSGETRRGIAELCFNLQRHCEERSDEAIHSYFAATWIASRSLSSGGALRRPVWLAMTVLPSTNGLASLKIESVAAIFYVMARSGLAAVAQRATASAEARRAKAEGGSDEAIHSYFAAPWIASRSLSSGAHSRDPLARNDDLESVN